VLSKFTHWGTRILPPRQVVHKLLHVRYWGVGEIHTCVSSLPYLPTTASPPIPKPWAGTVGRLALWIALAIPVKERGSTEERGGAGRDEIPALELVLVLMLVLELVLVPPLALSIALALAPKLALALGLALVPALAPQHE
jgi:hypothetical protein